MSKQLRVLDLFSGIGGFSLGLERTGGFRTVAFCEIEPFPRRVLAKHWPEVPCYDDVRTLTAERLRADGICVDVICGGFPCQDVSLSGTGEGLAGKRSGLWAEIARLAGELRPRFVIVENVSALLGRGLGTVLGDLAALGYDAEWHCIPASAVGAPHRRDRVWIVAHADQVGRGGRSWRLCWPEGRTQSADVCSALADANGLRKLQSQGRLRDERGWSGDRGKDVADATQPGLEIKIGSDEDKFSSTVGARQWAFEPDVGRMAYGVPARVDRISALGNAVVPQIPELIGSAILASLAHREAA